MKFIIHLLLTWAATYALLLGVFGTTCVVVERLNRRRNDKIQRERHTSDELVRRDRRQSVLSLMTIAALFAFGRVAHQELGWGWMHPELSATSALLSLLGSMLVFDAWFYWLHRLIHTRPLFKLVHRWHHATVTPVVWSNDSDTVLDNLFLQGYWAVAHLLLPIHPGVLIVHKVYDVITGVIGHSGYEYGGRLAMPPSPMLSVTHHDQHHRYFNCNYATHFSLWDRLMGTLHPSHDEEARRNIETAEGRPQGASPAP